MGHLNDGDSKEFYEFMLLHPWSRLLVFFELLVSIAFLTNLLFTCDFSSVVPYFLALFFIWLVYFMVMGVVYEQEVVMPRNVEHLKKLVVQEFGEDGEKVISFILHLQAEGVEV